jgi:hypothetical protein
MHDALASSGESLREMGCLEATLGMTNKHDGVEGESVEDSCDVHDRILGYSRPRVTRSPHSPARDSEHMERVGQLRRELVELVRRMAAAGQKHQRRARTTPVEDLQCCTRGRCHAQDAGPHLMGGRSEPLAPDDAHDSDDSRRNPQGSS